MKLQDAYLGGLMDKATEKLVATEETGTVDLSKSETWSFHEEDPLLTKQLQENLEHPANQKTREIPKLEEKNGHTTYTFLTQRSLYSEETCQQGNLVSENSNNCPITRNSPNDALMRV